MIKGFSIKGIACFLSCLCVLAASAQQTMNLSGQWQVRLGTGKVQPIALPGTLDGAGIGTPNTLQPIVESVDNFVNNRRLAQVFEAKVGKGSLIFSSIDLLTDAHLPELRQMQYSLVQYMLSDAFKPAMQLSEADVRSLILEKAIDSKTDANSIYN